MKRRLPREPLSIIHDMTIGDVGDDKACETYFVSYEQAGMIFHSMHVDFDTAIKIFNERKKREKNGCNNIQLNKVEYKKIRYDPEFNLGIIEDNPPKTPEYLLHPIDNFLLNVVEVEEDSMIPLKEFYEEYLNWCDKHILPKVDCVKFKPYVEECGLNIINNIVRGIKFTETK